MRIEKVAEYLDDILNTAAVPDYAGAVNGVQVANRGEIQRVAFAVDASQATIDGAVRGGANLLVVHHGLFWDGAQPLTGRRYRRLKALFDADVAVYSSHLPLDLHPELGNNPVLARALGVEIQGLFGDYKGVEVGVWGLLQIRREALAARLDELLGGPVRMVAGGPERVARVGVITGGAGGQIADARRVGLDAFVTGEIAHHHYFDAIEGGINLYAGGHYATEVWGVRALSERMGRDLGLECFFVDNPTGL